MKTFKLVCGGEQIELSKLSFGAGVFETFDKESHYFSLMDYYYNKGGRVLDTARVYCSWLPGGDGVSEALVGKWIKQHANRHEMVISTKGGHPPLADMNHSRLSKEDLEHDLHESLKALQTDYADLYFLHRDDERMDVADIMPTLHNFVQEGKVRFLGASNWTARRIELANQFAVKNGLTPFSISQINYSLAETTPEKVGDPTIVCMNTQEYQWYLANQFPVMAFCSQAKGFFAKYVSGETPSKKIVDRFTSVENMHRLERAGKICRETGWSAAAVALAYLTCNSINVSAVIGASKLEQLQDSMKETGVTLSADMVRFLETGK